jgi:hypothetical protein
MDPISALNIAAAAVGFFDFALGLLKDYGELREKGQKLTHAAFEKAAKDLIACNNAMQKRPKIIEDPNGLLAEHDQALEQLLTGCSVIAQRLIDALDSLRPKADAGRWSSFLQAMKTIWRADELQDLKNQLELYRGQLVIRVLAVLNAKMEVSAHRQDQAFESLEQNDTEIVEILTFIHQDLATRLDDQYHGLKMDLASQEGLIKQQYAGITQAFLTFRNGETKFVTPMEDPKSENTNKRQSKLEPKSVMTLRAPVSNGTSEAKILSFESIKQMVLNCLHYRQISDRFESIKEAHQKTFQWIFCSPDEVGKPWSDFPKWLEEGKGCYWINGKAGSGKSTLMKFIYQDPRTNKHLWKWAAEMPLITASFFFWYVGSSLQKSQFGLLRSLLFDILDRNPELIPRAMPDLCREASKLQRASTLAEPTLPELTRWFKRLGKLPIGSFPYRICFFIDGLDEYVGDYSDLIDLLLEVSSSTTAVKFVLSSRPVTACTDTLSHFPGIRLQDLTREDIKSYAQDLLGDKLKKHGGDEWSLITGDIVDKSSGVFLWVYLAVRSLLGGLRDGDSFKELRKRLEELPSDLKELYRHMLGRIPENYMSQASELFQLVMTNMQGLNGDAFLDPLLALQLSFALEDEDFVFQAHLKPLEEVDKERRQSQVDARIRSRCLGLLEIQERMDDKYISFRSSLPFLRKSRTHLVTFIHKTAAEFLLDDEVHAMLENLTISTDFNPYKSLFSSCILMAKSYKQKRKDLSISRDDDNFFWATVQSGLLIASEAERQKCPLPNAYLDEFDNTISCHWRAAEFYIGPEHRPNGEPWQIPVAGHWFQHMTYVDPRFEFHETILRSLLEPDKEPKIETRLPSPGHTGPCVQTDLAWTRTSKSVIFARVDDSTGQRLMGDEQMLGFTRVAITFSLTVYVMSWLSTRSARPLKLSEPDDASHATKLLEHFVFSLTVLEFEGLTRRVWTEQNVAICNALFTAGADPNHPTIGSSKGHLSIWTLLLCSFHLRYFPSPRASRLRCVDSDRPDSDWADSDAPQEFDNQTSSALERIFKSFLVNNANINARFILGGAWFTPISLLRYEIESLERQVALGLRNISRLVAALERLCDDLEQRNPHAKNCGSQSPVVVHAAEREIPTSDHVPSDPARALQRPASVVNQETEGVQTTDSQLRSKHREERVDNQGFSLPDIRELESGGHSSRPGRRSFERRWSLLKMLRK